LRILCSWKRRSSQYDEHFPICYFGGVIASYDSYRKLALPYCTVNTSATQGWLGLHQNGANRAEDRLISGRDRLPRRFNLFAFILENAKLPLCLHNKRKTEEEEEKRIP